MTEQMIDGLQALKNEATQLGIRFHPKIGEAKLLKKINDFRKISTIPTETLSNETKKVRPTIATKDSMTLEEYNKFTNKKKSRESGALVRVQITNLNPAKREWPGEIISVGSSKLGTFKKYIPYNTDAPYHIPRIMLDVMKERKYIMVKYGKTDKRASYPRKCIYA